MGIMLQDPFLFRRPSWKIPVWTLNASDKECIEAAKAVHAHEFIMRLPMGYETKINDQGSGVSAVNGS
jgi:ATP-binding cassette subfamily B protein